MIAGVFRDVEYDRSEKNIWEMLETEWNDRWKI